MNSGSALNFEKLGFTMLRTAMRTYGQVRPEAAAQWAKRLFMTPRRNPSKAWEAEVEASAERFRLNVGWSGLRWKRSGGPRVLCLHGWQGRATQFGVLAERLHFEGYDVFALDAPGHGASPEAQAHPVAFARALMDADREIGPFTMIIGHSMGAAATGLALSWGFRADRAVSLAGPASIEGVLDRFRTQVGLPGATFAEFSRLLERHVGFSPASLSIDAIAARLQIPGLIFHDPEDDEVPFADGQAVADAWRGAQLVSVQGLGHRRILRDPDVITQIAAFGCPRRH